MAVLLRFGFSRRAMITRGCFSLRPGARTRVRISELCAFIRSVMLNGFVSDRTVDPQGNLFQRSILITRSGRRLGPKTTKAELFQRAKTQRRR